MRSGAVASPRLIAWKSRAVRATKMRGVASATSVLVRSGTTTSRSSLSSWPLLPLIDSRSVKRPGGASNDTDIGPVAAAAVAGGPPAASGGASGDVPRKTVSPSIVAATTPTDVGFSRRTPGAAAIGSHTIVTFVLPSAPRAVPTQVRTNRPRDGSEIDDSARVTAAGALGRVGAVARAVSTADSAQ